MKLKYYLRGMGIGIILTAIVMGFALGGRSKTMSDAEVIQRAKALGMVEGEPNVLSGTPIDESESESEGDTNDASASDETLDEEGEEISEEDEQGESLSDTSISEVAEEESEAEEEDQSGSSTSVETSSETKNKPSVINAAGSETDVVTTGTASSTEDTDSSKTADSSKIEESTAASETSTEESSAASETSTQESTASSGKYTTSSAHSVTIPGGQGSEQVAQILLREGVIDDAASFNKYLVDRRIDRIIRSGVKNIPEGADYETIASIITK